MAPRSPIWAIHDERNGEAVVAAAVAELIAADTVAAAAAAAAVDEHIGAAETVAAASATADGAVAAAAGTVAAASAAADETVAAASTHYHVTAAAHSTPETTAAVVRVHLAVAHALHYQTHHDFAAGPHCLRRANHHRRRVHGGRLSLPVAAPSPVPPRTACPGHYTCDLRTKPGPFLPLRSEIY